MKQNDSQQITLESKSSKYAAHLRNDTDRPGVLRTIDYLKRHGLKGVRGREIAEKYQLGFVNPAEPADRPYEGRLAIPYITPTGVVWMKYRCVEDHVCKDIEDHAKYVAPFGEEPWIFNSPAFFDADDTIGVAEGEIDAIVATELLGIPSIGIPGVEIWQQNRKIWRRTLDDYANILIFADGDPPSAAHPGGAGMEFARSVAEDVGVARSRIVRCPLNEDVASMVASGKGDILREKAGLISEQRAN